MKTTMIIWMWLAGTMFLMASEPEPRFPDNVIKHVQQAGTYSEQAVTYNVEGFVDVVFEVTREGRIEVKEYFGTDALLSEQVLKNLNEVRMCPFDLSVGKQYKVRYSFSLL